MDYQLQPHQHSPFFKEFPTISPIASKKFHSEVSILKQLWEQSIESLTQNESQKTKYLSGYCYKFYENKIAIKTIGVITTLGGVATSLTGIFMSSGPGMIYGGLVIFSAGIVTGSLPNFSQEELLQKFETKRIQKNTLMKKIETVAHLINWVGGIV